MKSAAFNSFSSSNGSLASTSRRRPLTEVLDELCTLIHDKSDGIVPAIFLLAADGRHLRLTSGPKVPKLWGTALENLRLPLDASFHSTGGHPGNTVWGADLRIDGSFA